MVESMKDQLAALGLTRSAPDSKKSGARKRKCKGEKPGALSLDEAYRLREQAEKQSAADRKRRKIEEDRRRREINGKIQELVDEHALNDPQAKLKRNFIFKGRIRSVLVTSEQLKAVNSGDLGVVFLRGSYYLLAPELVEKAREISPEHVPDLGAGDAGEDEEFPVPDDLVW